MKYIVLLRGINISGKNKIAMSELKKILESNNYSDVRTYLNSGNVILNSDNRKEYIIDDIKTLIKKKFNLEIPVYVMEHLELKDILEHNPNWLESHNKEIYDNIIFIMPPISSKDVFDSIGEPSKGIDGVKEYNNIIFWSFDLNNYQKSNWWKRTATESVKDQITIRTVNTMKKILELCNR
ncbi:MAG: DUF1697 domain-containing protein [Bacilli bacterium]|nr:DUF1697 domain-containing protein [Bacilli bacterium]